jgi:hypothetical protein
VEITFFINFNASMIFCFWQYWGLNLGPPDLRLLSRQRLEPLELSYLNDF